MAMMQPPVEPELATKQDVQRVDEKVDRLDEKVDRLDEKVDRLDENVHQMDKKFERLDGTLQIMREHMATKADVERMGRILAIWMVGAIAALMAAVVTVVSDLTNAVLQLAK